MRKTLIVLLLFLLLLTSCQTTNNKFSVGTTGSMFGIDPFPSAYQWKAYLNKINSNFSKNAENTVLWIVGSYIDNGIKFNFPGQQRDNQNIYYSEIDYNEDFFTYFDKNNISVYILIEPGEAFVEQCIYIVLKKYEKHKSIEGVCIDLEWYDNNHKVTKKNIESWSSTVSKINSNYTLMLKHWNITKIDSVPSNKIIYIQSMEGISGINELKKRHALWYRKFYPSHVGIEIGFESDFKFWVNYIDPVFELEKELEDITKDRSSIYWSEKTLIDYFELRKARDE